MHRTSLSANPRGGASTKFARRGQSGFTLIELVVVIALLAILGGVVVYAARSIVNNADVDACLLEHRTIRTAQGVADASGGPNGTYKSFLENPLAPRYFERTGGTDQAPIWGPTTLHPGADCPSDIS